MNSRRLILLISGCVVGVFLFVLLRSPTVPADPVYAGRVFSSWLNDLAPKTSVDDRRAAQAAVIAIGTNGLPLLVSYLSKSSSSPKFVLHNFWRKVRGLPELPDPIYERLQAIEAFETLGPVAAQARPALEALMRNRDLAYDAAKALGFSQEKDLCKVFERYLKSSDPRKRCAGLAGFESLAHLAQANVGEISSLATNDQDDNVRACAVSTLGAIAVEQTVIRLLIASLQTDPSAKVRCCAAVSLGNFPEQERMILPILEQARTNRFKEVRAGANLALMRLHRNIAADAK